MSVFNWLTEAYKAWDRCPIVDPGNAGSIQVRQSGPVHLRSAGVETRTLPRPGAKGTHLFIDMEADGGDITLTVTGGYNEAGTTTFTFSDPGQFLYLVSVYESASGLYEWRKISDYNTGNVTTGAVSGVAAGYKLARGETALDGSNPTPVATGLTTIVAAVVTLKGTAAPGVGTSVLTVDFTGTDGTLNVYAWKPTSNADPTLIASTGTETFEWVVIGT